VVWFGLTSYSLMNANVVTKLYQLFFIFLYQKAFYWIILKCKLYNFVESWIVKHSTAAKLRHAKSWFAQWILNCKKPSQQKQVKTRFQDCNIFLLWFWRSLRCRNYWKIRIYFGHQATNITYSERGILTNALLCSVLDHSAIFQLRGNSRKLFVQPNCHMFFTHLFIAIQ